jgi:putative flippase GtrA
MSQSSPLKRVLERQKIFRFILVGILNTIFGYGFYALLVFAGMKYTLAILFSTIAGIIFNFRTTGVLVFQNKDKRLFLKFLLVYALIYGLNVESAKMLNSLYSMSPYLSQAVILPFLATISYLLNRYFVFKEAKDKAGAELAVDS